MSEQEIKQFIELYNNASDDVKIIVEQILIAFQQPFEFLAERSSKAQ